MQYFIPRPRPEPITYEHRGRLTIPDRQRRGFLWFGGILLFALALAGADIPATASGRASPTPARAIASGPGVTLLRDRPRGGRRSAPGDLSWGPAKLGGEEHPASLVLDCRQRCRDSSPASISINLDGQYRVLTGAFGIPDDSPHNAIYELTALVDGNQVASYRSADTGHPVPIEIPVTGAQELTIIITRITPDPAAPTTLPHVALGSPTLQPA